MQLIDVNHPFYRPLWIRIAIVVFCFGWAVVELVGRQPFWAIISGALGVYSAYRLLFAFHPKPAEPDVVADE